jgi:tetratricopeptide (TPR) repeat protein
VQLAPATSGRSRSLADTPATGEDARAFYQLGWARAATGEPTAALAAYDQALRLDRAAGHRGNEAATLSNIGEVYRGLGEPRGRWSTTGRCSTLLCRDLSVSPQARAYR